MSLPKLNTPVYEAILPSTEKVIKFRPFLVKEEKVLLTAMEDGSQPVLMNAIKTIIKNCIQDHFLGTMIGTSSQATSGVRSVSTASSEPYQPRRSNR